MLFFYDGKDRAEKYADQWQRASLSEYIEKYAPGSKGVVNPEKGKITYQNEGGRYVVIYDYRGDYFRIKDSQLHNRRNHTDLEGRNMANVTENGKTRGRTKSEYERDTHFSNQRGVLD